MKPAKITIRSERDRNQAARWLDHCPFGYTILFKPPTRSLMSNARMWAMLDDVAEQKEWAGRKWPSEAWKDLFSASLRGQEMVPNLDGNGFIAFGSRTSEFSPEEMSDMITLIEAWGAEQGVQFTDQIQESPTAGERAGTADSKNADGAGVPARKHTEEA